MLLRMTSSIALSTACRGNPYGSWWVFDRLVSHAVITSIAWSVSMLVYMLLASAVKIRAFDGSAPSSCSFVSSSLLSLM